MELAYQEAYENLDKDQRLAVNNTEGPLLVIAGPGAGKTQLLTVRVAYILANTDTAPHNILCLTFTESATQTMRERLVNLIGQAAYDVTISTYHSFGSELIRRFPDYFSDIQGRRPADDLAIDSLVREIINHLSYSNPLKFATTYVDDIKSFISDSKRALLTPEDLHAIANHNQAFLRQAQPIITKQLENFRRVDKKSVTNFKQLLSVLSKLKVQGKPPKGITPEANLLLQQLTKALDEVDITHKTTPLTQWKNTWLVRDQSDTLTLNGERICRRLHALADIYSQYLQSLITNGLFDYDDMILQAVTVLKKTKELRYTLQEQYLYLLLDEFQDTNVAQFELVKLLTDNPLNEKRPNILAVGDDDQAIYAFQGAHYSHLLEFRNRYRDVLVIELNKNYRSDPGILHLAEGITEQIQERVRNYLPGIGKQLTSVSKSQSSDATVERREAKSDVAHYAWTAKRIKQLVNQGTPASDIAVLAPQHRYIEPLVAFLHQQRLAVRYEKRENVLDDPAINQLLRMSELCLSLMNDSEERASSLWPEVLSFDFWGLSTRSIWQLAWQASDLSQPWTSLLLSDEQFKHIALFFVRLSTMVKNETLETMLDYLIGTKPMALHEPDRSTFESPFYDFYFGDQAQASKLGLFWQLLTNLTVLRSHLREYRPNDSAPLLLSDLLVFVTDHQQANIKIINTSPYHEADQAVQLMTAFKAKGQEFKVVFLLACNDEVWGSRSISQSSRISLPPNLQHIRYAGTTNDERLRLFYVALTRAKQYLYLVNYTGTFSGRTTNRLKYLNEALNRHGVLQSPLLPAGQRRVLSAGDETLAPSTELTAYWQQKHQSALTKKDFSALLRHRLERFQLSPTHIKSFIDLLHAGPSYFFIHNLLRFPKAPSPDSQFGNAIHETLEWIHIQNKQKKGIPSLKSVMKTFENCLEAKKISKEHAELLKERGRICLSAYLKQRAHTVLAANISEYSFRNENVFINQVHMSGKIDKMIVDHKKKTITIVDYKTGRAYRRWQPLVKLHLDRQQLYFYKLLVERSRSFSGYKVTDAYLEFVEPDNEGIIHELHLDFNEQESTNLQLLATAVWEQIQSLQFPSTSDYSTDLKGIEQFEQDLVSRLAKKTSQ